MKSKSIILLAVSLGFGLVAAFGISQVLGRNSGTAEAPPQKMQEVLIAKETIDQWSEFSEENVVVKEWPEELVPEDAITTMDELKDMVARSRVPKNSPLLIDHTLNKKDSQDLEIRPGHHVITISVNSELTFGGLLQPGHHVNIIAVFQAKGKNGLNQVFSKTFLKNIRVFAIDSQTAISEEQGAAASAAVVSVEVTREQAEKIVLVQSVATLRLSLVGEEGTDDSNVDPLDVMTLADVFEDNRDPLGQAVAQQATPSNEDPSDTESVKQSPVEMMNPTPVAQTAPKEKEFKMVILGQSGAQTYKWRKGEVPTLDNPMAQGMPQNGPTSPPPSEPPAGFTEIGPPQSKDSDQGDSEADSGNKPKVSPDEFDEGK